MIVAGIVGLLAEIAIPNFLEAKKTGQRSACINNLRQIDSAKQQWALEELRPANVAPSFADIAPYFGHGNDDPASLYCPNDPKKTFDNSYDPADLLTPPGCLIEVSHVLD